MDVYSKFFSHSFNLFCAAGFIFIEKDSRHAWSIFGANVG